MSSPADRTRSSGSDSLVLAAGFSLAALVIHMICAGAYGYFRDELYFLACGEHLDWGYVDHAPLAAWIVKLNRTLLGDSLYALRFPTALAAAAKVLLTGLLARELGGGRFAVGLACLGVLFAPVYLAIDSLYSMNSFEPLFWMGCVYVLILVIKRQDPRLLVWFGVLAGLGLENKHSMIFFGAALVIGLALTPGRRLFLSKWMWIAAALAIALFLPNLIWQHSRGWPTLEDLENVRRSGKNVVLSPLAFIGQQIAAMSPLNLLVWGPGLWFLLTRDGGRWRALGIAFLAVFAIMLALHGKDYYLAPAYPIVFAAGGVFWESRKRFATVVAVLIVITTLPAVPMVLPVLPPDRLTAYMERLGMKPPKTEVNHEGLLPQHFGDRFGWPEMVEKVSGVYNALPPEERAKAAIFTGNYGEAGAIDFFGPRYGLPKAISGHQTYFFWGPREYTGEVVIVLQGNRERLESQFASVTDGPQTGHPFGMAEENYTIYICRGLKAPLREVWPRTKHWN